jgi:hypothetical protein
MFVFMTPGRKNEEELTDFVRKKLKKGYPEGELRNDLLQQGYTDEEIQKAVYNPPLTEAGKKKEAQRNQDNNPLWYLASVGLLITGIAIKSVSYYKDSSAGTLLIVVGAVGLAAKIFMAIKDR